MVGNGRDSEGQNGSRGNTTQRGGERVGREEVEWESVNVTDDTETRSFQFTSQSGPCLHYARDAAPYEYFTHFLGDDF